MHWHLALAIRLWFLFIFQDSFTTSKDTCSSIAYSYSPEINALTLLIEDIISIPKSCSCDINTDRATVACSVFACSPCLDLPVLATACTSDSCFCSTKIADLTISQTCIYASIELLSCPQARYEPHSCQVSTKFALNLSTASAIPCTAVKNDKDLFIIIQSTEIEDDDKTSEHMFKEKGCAARTVTPNASNTSPTPATSIYSSVATTAKIERQSSFESTPKPEITGSRTLVSGSMIMNMTDEPLQNPSMMMSYDSVLGRNIGVGVGVGGGILLIFAIIIVILIFRRRRAESQKLHANDTTQTTAVDAAAPSETSYESYRVPVGVPYDNATNGVTASGYQTITYDNEPIGESNDGYTEINEAVETSDHNGYDECRIGRNEVYSMYHKTGNDFDKVSENPSMNIENETTVIDNDLYG